MAQRRLLIASGVCVLLTVTFVAVWVTQHSAAANNAAGFTLGLAGALVVASVMAGMLARGE